MTEAEWIVFLQRPEIPAFNRAMLANPADDLPRLVFADWIEENCRYRRFVITLRRSVIRSDVVIPCPSFPVIVGRVGLWRGRLALSLIGSPGRLRREEHDFLQVVLRSGWVGRLTVWFRGAEDTVVWPASSIPWADVEWLELGGHIEWKPAIREFVLSDPARFPRLRTLVNLDETPTGPTLDEMLQSPLLNQLTRLDLGFGHRWPEVVESIQRSPHLSPEWKARLLR